MQRFALLFLAAAALVFCGAYESRAEKRVALVIGNSQYAYTQKLANPESDAKLIASVLRKQGFDVIEHKNLGFKAMKRAVRRYTAKLRKHGKDTVGLIFFAGHGLQAEGRNFLVPVDAQIESEGDIDIETISAESLMSGVRLAGNRLNIIILDACRNNPYRGLFRSSSRGFARMDAPVGSLLAFSTAPGTVAADGVGANSPYSAALAKAMAEPGLKIEGVFKSVREKVYAATGGKQVPWESSSVFGDFFFSKGKSKNEQESPKAPSSLAAQAWNAVKNSKRASDLKAFVRRFPDSFFSELARSRLAELEKTQEQEVAIGTFPEKPAIAGKSATKSTEKPRLKLVIAHGLAPLLSVNRTIRNIAVPRLKKYSEGRLEVDLKGEKKICSEHKCVEQALLGQVDIAMASSGNMGYFGSTFDINFLPFIFKDDESANQLLNGWYGDYLAKAAAERKKDPLHVLAVVVSMGFRNLANSVREIRVPKDLKGLKIRVTRSPVEFSMIKDWGATPVPYNWGQLYEGLKSGVVHGFYIPDAFMAARRFQEVTPYITRVGGGLVTHVIVMKKERYDSLPSWAKQAIDRAFEDVKTKHLAIDRAARANLIKTMKPKARFYAPNAQELELWKNGALPAWQKLKGRYSPKIARRLLQEQGLTYLLSSLERAGVL